MAVEAVSATVLAPSTPRVGILGETSYGVSLDSSGADGKNYRKLPVVQAVPPTISRVRESRLLSGAGLVKKSTDTFIAASGRGGTVTMPFDMLATPKLTSQMLGLVCQEASHSSSVITHEIGGQGSMLSAVGGTISSQIPHTVQLAYDTGTAGEGIRINGCLLSDLTMTMASGSNNNQMSLSGNFYSGHSFMNTGNSQTTSAVEQDFSGGSWVAPETTYFSMNDISAKFLTVDDDTDGSTLVFNNFSLSISNGANRSSGGNSDGDAEYIALPEYAVTGSISIKYDANFDYGGGMNVLQDFLAGSTETLTIKIGDGTVSAVGEMNIVLNVQYTEVGQDLSESGIFHTLGFEGVSTGTGDGNEAVQITNYAGEAITAWTT